jgi:hypothetical protein
MRSTTSASGITRTCRGGLTTSAPEGRTDLPRKQRHFRFWTRIGHERVNRRLKKAGRSGVLKPRK